MIERHVTFEVFEDKSQDFENLFSEEYRPAMASMLGFVKVDLLRLQDSSTTYQMVIRFETLETAAAFTKKKSIVESYPGLFPHKLL